MALYFDFIFTDHHSLPNNVWTKQWVHFWENVYLIKQLNKWTRLACLQSRENYLLNSVFPKTVLLIGDFLVVLVNFLSWLFNNYNRDLGLVALINNNKNSAQSSSLDRRPERPNKPQACRFMDQCIFDAEQLALGCLLEESQIGPVCLLLDVFAIYFSYMTIKCENIMR